MLPNSNFGNLNSQKERIDFESRGTTVLRQSGGKKKCEDNRKDKLDKFT